MLWASISEARAQETILQTQFWGIEEGLSHRDVQCIHQDRQGFMWFGTKYGLNRFDGYDFKWFTQEKSGLQANEINFIEEDLNGKMWLFHTGAFFNKRVKSIDIFDPQTHEARSLSETFGTAVPFKADEVRVFTRNKWGHLVFLTPNRLITWTGKFEVIPISLNRENILFWNIHWAANGNFWLVLKTGERISEIHILDKRGKTLQQYVHPESYLNIYELDAQGGGKYVACPIDAYVPSNLSNQFFCLSPNGIQAVDTAAARYFSSYGISIPSIYTIFTKHGDQYFAYSDDAFHLLPLTGGRPLLLSDEYKGMQKSTSIYPDRDGAVWVGAQFGLYRIRVHKPRFRKLFFNRKGAVNGDPFAMRKMVADRHGQLWAMVENDDALWKADLTTGHESRIFKPVDKAAALAQNASGQILFQKRFLYQIDPLTYKIVKKDPIRMDTTVASSSWVIHEDKYGKIWFDCQNERELRYSHAGKFTVLKNWAGEHVHAFAYQFLENQTDTAWVVTSAGLFTLNIRTGQVLRRYWHGGQGQYHLPYENINHALRATDGSFWLATAGEGLVRWHPQKGLLARFTLADGLPNNTLYAIYEDAGGNFWLSTDNGIAMFNPLTKQGRAYSQKDGLSHHEFNRVAHCRDEKGTIYFGGLNGVTAFHPNDFLGDTSLVQIPVAVTGFYQFDGEQEKLLDRTVELRQSNTITMLPADRFFLLEFALLTFEDLKNVQYAWRVEGVDIDWTYQKENSLRLSRLPYGKHQLRIKGQASNGQWSDKELRIAVLVLRPVYLQTGFLVLLLLGIVSAIIGFYRWRVSSLKARHNELEHEVAERTRQISKDKETIEQQAEELKSLEKLKSRFFANVSHELRTPLTLILGPVGALLKRTGKKGGEETKLLQFVERNARQLQKLINEILDLSKLEAGKLEVVEDIVQFFPYLKEQLAQFYSAASSDGLRFELKYRADKSLKLLLDKSKFEKIVHNFLSNAMKFTPPGGTVVLAVEEFDDKLQLTVTDTGLGIHPDDLPHIFDRFYQAPPRDFPKERVPKASAWGAGRGQGGGGTGIGLSLCKELAQVLGGNAWAESEWGKGSVFYFKFPKKLAGAEAGSGADVGTVEHSGAYGGAEEHSGAAVGVLANSILDTELVGEDANKGKDTFPTTELVGEDANKGEKEGKEDATEKSTILIVEDNLDLREYLQFLLADYRVLTAEHGQAALELLDALPVAKDGAGVDLLISDLMMPVMDGFQLLETLKSDDRWRHLPVIMLTAKVNARAKLQALRIGVDDYLTKPFEEEELKARIENLLRNYRERMEHFSAEENGGSSELLVQKPVIAQVDSDWLKEVEIVFSKILSDRHFNLEWVASELSLSSRQVNRRLLKLTGLSPGHYLQEMRLQMAKDHLLNGKFATVKETGFAVGFRDTNYFSTLFQQRFGVAPSSYLR